MAYHLPEVESGLLTPGPEIRQATGGHAVSGQRRVEDEIALAAALVTHNRLRRLRAGNGSVFIMCKRI